MTRATGNHSDMMCTYLCLDDCRAAMHNPALSLVLCPCALHALEHQQPVDCRCDAAAACAPLAASPEIKRAVSQPLGSWASNPTFDQDSEYDVEEDTKEHTAEAQHPAAGTAASTGYAPQQGRQSEPHEPQESWVSNRAFQEVSQEDSGDEWDVLDGYLRLRCIRKPACNSHS